MKLQFEGGFGASVAVMMLSFGILAISLAADQAAFGYADIVDKRIDRVQKVLDQKACDDSIAIIKAKDIFVHGIVSLPEFGCSINL